MTAQHIDVLTYKGIGMGAMTISLMNPVTGVTVASRTVSLGGSGPLSLASVAIDNPSTNTVLVTVEAHLSNGEEFYFDGFRFIQ